MNIDCDDTDESDDDSDEIEHANESSDSDWKLECEDLDPCSDAV